jgi:hypothetical protein
VVHDVNENFMTQARTRPRQHFMYSCALFSAGGFTSDAQKYALAHQISLVDLSGASFAWLLGHTGATQHFLVPARPLVRGGQGAGQRPTLGKRRGGRPQNPLAVLGLVLGLAL